MTGFKGQGSVGSVVKHALQRAKFDSPRKGSHQFRHTLASTMLQKNSSLGLNQSCADRITMQRGAQLFKQLVAREFHLLQFLDCRCRSPFHCKVERI
jgi:hypothetical protein